MSKEDFYLIDLKSRFDKIKPNTYYLSYSGGKDSHFLYWFIKEYLHRDDIKIVGINTYMEHHEILKRILKNCDIVLLPKLKPFEIKELHIGLHEIDKVGLPSLLYFIGCSDCKSNLNCSINFMSCFCKHKEISLSFTKPSATNIPNQYALCSLSIMLK